MTHDEDVRLVDKLRSDAEACAGHDECQVPLMYCAFGPADHCDEYAALWLRILSRYDALVQEHEVWAVDPEANDEHTLAWLKVEGLLAQSSSTSHDGETTPDGRSRREG